MTTYEAEFEAHENYLRVHVTDTRRYGDAAVEAGQVWRQIVECCRNANTYRVLLVLNLSGRLTVIDSLDIVTQSPDYGWDYAFKLAFVDTN